MEKETLATKTSGNLGNIRLEFQVHKHSMELGGGGSGEVCRMREEKEKRPGVKPHRVFHIMLKMMEVSCRRKPLCV